MGSIESQQSGEQLIEALRYVVTDEHELKAVAAKHIFAVVVGVSPHARANAYLVKACEKDPTASRAAENLITAFQDAQVPGYKILPEVDAAAEAAIRARKFQNAPRPAIPVRL